MSEISDIVRELRDDYPAVDVTTVVFCGDFAGVGCCIIPQERVLAIIELLSRHAQCALPEPINFFSENVDAWGAAEWFNRLATAIRQQDAAVLANDDATMEICRNVAASSAMRLVREYEQQVRAALSSTECGEKK